MQHPSSWDTLKPKIFKTEPNGFIRSSSVQWLFIGWNIDLSAGISDKGNKGGRTMFPELSQSTTATAARQMVWHGKEWGDQTEWREPLPTLILVGDQEEKLRALWIDGVPVSMRWTEMLEQRRWRLGVAGQELITSVELKNLL